MAILLTLEVIISDKNCYQIAINIFHKYMDKNFKNMFFWKIIKIDFKY